MNKTRMQKIEFEIIAEYIRLNMMNEQPNDVEKEEVVVTEEDSKEEESLVQSKKGQEESSTVVEKEEDSKGEVEADPSNSDSEIKEAS